MGRLKKEVDFDQVEKLCQMLATKAEICHILGVAKKTLDRRISEEYPGQTFEDIRGKPVAKVNIAIRKKQVEQALDGDSGLLKWLGINMLGQSDKPKSESPGISKALSDAFEIGIMERKDRGNPEPDGD